MHWHTVLQLKKIQAAHGQLLLVTEYESLSLPFSRRWYLYVLVIQVCSSCTTSDNIRPTFPRIVRPEIGSSILKLTLLNHLLIYRTSAEP